MLRSFPATLRRLLKRAQQQSSDQIRYLKNGKGTGADMRPANCFWDHYRGCDGQPFGQFLMGCS